MSKKNPEKTASRLQILISHPVCSNNGLSYIRYVSKVPLRLFIIFVFLAEKTFLNNFQHFQKKGMVGSEIKGYYYLP